MKSPFERLLDEIDWQEMPYHEPTNVPVATHQGILKIGDFELRVYRLSNGERVIEQSDLIRFFGG